MHLLTSIGPQCEVLLGAYSASEDLSGLVCRLPHLHSMRGTEEGDRDTLPRELQPALLALLLRTLGDAVSPSNHLSYQTANAVVVRKLFGCVGVAQVFLYERDAENSNSSSSPACSSDSRSTIFPTPSSPSSKRFPPLVHFPLPGLPRGTARPVSCPTTRGESHIRCGFGDWSGVAYASRRSDEPALASRNGMSFDRWPRSGC